MPSSSPAVRRQPSTAATASSPPLPLSSFLAGIAGGSASTILLYPLDLIKVRMQVDEGRRRRGGSSVVSKINAAAPPTSDSSVAGTPRTTCHTVKGVIRHEGYLGLYRGLAPAIIGSAASWGGFFILYEETKRKMLARKRARVSNASSSNIRGEYDLRKDMHVDEEIDINTNAASDDARQEEVRLGSMEHFSASCLAGACMVALTNPLWLIKTRLQLQNSHLQQQISQPRAADAAEATQRLKPAYRGMLHAAFTIVKEEGVLALYKGSVPALMLVSHGGIQFVAYEFLKRHFAIFTNNNDGIKGGNRRKEGGGDGRNGRTIGQRMRDSLGYLVMGAASKFVASTTTYPLQVIKARLQQRSQAVEVSETTGKIVVTKREYSGVADCVGRMWRNEGAGGFFKGCLTNAIRVAPSAAITFVTYEFVLDVLAER